MPVSRGGLSLIIIASPRAELTARWSQAFQREYAIHVVTDRIALERGMASLKPAILLLDLALPKLAKGRGTAAIQRLCSSAKTIVFAKNLNDKEGAAMLKVGARGYCSSDIGPRGIKRIVEMVKKGEIWVGRKVIHHLLEDLAFLTRRLQKNLHGNPDGRLDCLTPREREIVHQIGNGASNKEIASRLNVSEKTVKAHLTGIFRKLEVSDRLHLALLVTNSDRSAHA